MSGHQQRGIVDPLLGTHVFEASAARYALRRKCVCSDLNPECKKITKKFYSLGDSRGYFLAVPSLEGTRNVEIKKHKVRRICHHLGLGEDNYEKYASVDNRYRGKDTEEGGGAKMKLRSDKSQKRETRHVAAWHFHPEVLRHMYQGGKKKMVSVDYLKEDFVVEAGLLDKGYTEGDVFEGEASSSMKRVGKVYAPVPCYPPERALADYNLAVSSKKLGSIIESCTDKTLGRSFHAPIGKDGEEEPAEKVARLVPQYDMTDLSHAICLLNNRNKCLEARLAVAENRITELEGANKKLEAEVEQRRETELHNQLQEELENAEVEEDDHLPEGYYNGKREDL